MQKLGAVRNKIRKFYQREKRAVQFKVSRGILTQDVKLIELVIKDRMQTMTKHPTWVRNIFIEMGESGRDFINNTKTIIINYTYPKYGKRRS